MHRLSVLAFVLLSGACTLPAHAGPAPPCVIATLSASRNILVLSDFTTEKEGAEEKVKTSTFRILRRHDEINTATRLDGPDTYWTWSVPLWTVDFTWAMPGFITCPYTLVTDDAEYLILCHNRFDFHTALSIYRRRDHPGQPSGGPGPDHGILIRDISLSEIWAEHMPLETTITDHTPQWYAGGTFAFSPDNKTLIHKTTWSQTVRIDLATGKITRQ